MCRIKGMPPCRILAFILRRRCFFCKALYKHMHGNMSASVSDLCKACMMTGRSQAGKTILQDATARMGYRYTSRGSRVSFLHAVFRANT